MEKYILEKILSETASSEEKKQFGFWYEQSKENKEYFQKLKIIYSRMNNLFEKREFDKELAKLAIRTKAKSQINKSRKVNIRKWMAAASFLLIIGLSFYILTQFNKYQSNKITYLTNDSVRDFLLEDGSHVWLNENSYMEVSGNFMKKQRKVTLKGEAFFEVKRMENCPFKVKTGKTLIKVLGTSFNIKEDTLAGNVSVVVSSGIVSFNKLYHRWERSYLKPSDHAQYFASNNKIIVKENKNLNYLSWKTNILHFYHAPIKEVCKDLSIHFHKNIKTHISDPDLLLTGSFENESLDYILKVMEISLDIKATYSNHEYVLQKNNN